MLRGTEAASCRSPCAFTRTPSKALRGDNVGRCLYCFNRIWWFDRADGGRIPLIPKQFPAARVPAHVRWNVDAGLARAGSNGDTCWIPHPVVCPGLEHEEFKDPGLADLYRQSSLNMQAAIREALQRSPGGDGGRGDRSGDAEQVAVSGRDAYHSVYLVAHDHRRTPVRSAGPRLGRTLRQPHRGSTRALPGRMAEQ
ncbi:DUF6083 domain-containing protein [Streptomyces katrae]|uniref:DUF6083 domain-containing protein n=1 Tax=Streptomyces katrae TaxID=68223 RepID=UPI003CCC3B18